MSSKSLLKKIISLADDKKAENIVALDVSKITSLSEYFVVCSASNLIQKKIFLKIPGKLKGMRMVHG